MGLDIYLTQKTFLGASGNRLLISGKLNIFKGGRKIDVDVSRIYEIVEYVGHWRKFHSLHRWVVENVLSGVSDCKEHLIESQQLLPLLENCRTILAQQRAGADWQKTAHLVFPWLHFENAEDWQLEEFLGNIQDTITAFERIREPSPDRSLIYQASW